MIHSSIFVLTVLIFLSADANAETDYLTEAEAKEELQIAVDFVKDNHPSPFWHTSRDEFEFVVRRVSDFEGKIGVAEHYFNLSEIYSLVVDTHTQLYPTLARPFVRDTFPIRVRGFSEGLYISAADDPYRHLVGKRIVKIGDQTASQVLDRLTKYAFSGNQYRKRVFAETFFFWPEMYRHLDLMGSDQRIKLVLENTDRSRESIILDKTQPISSAMIHRELGTSSWPDVPDGWATLDSAFDVVPPLYRRSMDKNYSYSYLPDQQAMYVQVNRPYNQDGEGTALEFNLEWFNILRTSDVKRFILDVRNNPGGWINVTEPIPSLLSAYRLDSGSIDEFIVLIGTDSVSAASVAVAQMERTISRTITIGQPTGSAPNIFLNANKMMLPYSKFEIEVSTAMMPMRTIDDRMFVAPDIWVDYSFEDFIRGEDPVLEAAFGVTEEMRKEFHKDRPPMQGWRRKSQDVALPRGKH